jgi:hypothetical protein
LIKGFVPQKKKLLFEGKTINKSCVQMFDRSLKWILKMMPTFLSGALFFLHDDIPTHSAMTLKSFLEKGCVVDISHPRYSTKQSTDQLFLFSQVKTALKVRSF